MYFLAISIAFSRVVLGMHFLSDVLAGAVLGSALGVASIVTFASYGLV
jgi:undecaprenyl-diphosphatase